MTAEHDTRIKLLLASLGQRLPVGRAQLYVDRDNRLIWGVDPAGCEHIAGRGLTPESAAQALAWAQQFSDGAA